METRSEPDRDGAQAVVLFDGVCNLCNAAVNFIIDHDPAARFMFAALQSEAGRALLDRYRVTGEGRESVVLIEEGRVYTHSGAVLRIARGLGGRWSVLYGLTAVPRPVRDAVYRWVSANRFRWFGRRETCRVPTPELRARFLE